MTRIKICGITRIEDALTAARAGTDAIGLVFYPQSNRFITTAQAKAICTALPPFIKTVGLFVNANNQFIHDILKEVPLDLLQFHGDETNEQCNRYHRPWIKALRVKPNMDILASIGSYPNAQGILLDTYIEGIQGGTGASFDWSLVPKNSPKPLILAGGLNASNVALAIQQTTPYAVDVSGGVEIAKGLKDAKKIKEFIKKVQSSL